MASNHKFEIEAKVRQDLGKGASRRLRRDEQVPGVVYGGGKDAVALVFDHRKTSRSLENEAFYSHILTLKINGEEERVVLKDVQRHPFKPRIQHIDLQRVRADVKIEMRVPLHFLGGEKSPGVKEGGLISHIESDVEVSCFPDKLPEYIEFDLAEMKLNEIFHLSDVKLPEGVEIVALAHGDDKPIVSLHMPRAEEEIPTEAPVASEVPAIAQKSETEEAKPAGGKEGKEGGGKEKE